jgi:hypothetical protein
MKLSSTAVPELVVVDMFCGAGGITTGLIDTAQQRTAHSSQNHAINHWTLQSERTSATIQRPRTRVGASTLWDTRKPTSDARIAFLRAAPECTHHTARALCLELRAKCAQPLGAGKVPITQNSLFGGPVRGSLFAPTGYEK